MPSNNNLDPLLAVDLANAFTAIDLLSYSLLYIAIVGAAWSLTGKMRNYALAKQIIDTPNHRSSHTQPTPRGGGLPAAILMLLISLTAWTVSIVDTNAVIGLAGCGAILIATGLVDDVRPLSSKIRFCIHLTCAAITVLLIAPRMTIPLPGFELEISPVICLLPIIAITWLTNLYNFMDGIDGIASAQAITTLLGAAILLLSQGDLSAALFLAMLSAPIAGFLIWNLPPARIFMGDACSGYLGFLFGTLSLCTLSKGVSLWAWIILLSSFWGDATWTLLKRMVSGQDWHNPHRSHAYQILARKLNSHGRVTASVTLFNLVWLLPLAWISNQLPSLGLPLTIIAIGPVAILCRLIGAGKNNPHS